MSTHYVFRQISKLVFTAFHLFFTYQNIFLCVERSQFYTKTSFFATTIVILAISGSNLQEPLKIQLTVASFLSFKRLESVFRDFRLENGVAGKNDSPKVPQQKNDVDKELLR